MTTLLTTIKHVSSDSLRDGTGMSSAGGVNKLGATLPFPGTAIAASYNFKVDDQALPQRTMPERARRARKEVKKRFQHGPLHVKDRDWANSTYVDGSKFSKKFSSNLLSNSAAPFNVTAIDHLEAQASTVINYGGSRSIVFSKSLLHMKWNNASKIDRNSIEESLNAKTEKALENTSRKCQQLKSYDTPWDAEQKFMDTIREEKISKKKEREEMEATYGSEALAYVDLLEERKRFLEARVNRKPVLIATQSHLKSPKISTLKGRTLQKYKNNISDVEALDNWEEDKRSLLIKQKDEDA
ncbi:hypothetical protein HOP50_20g85550 [Chloropicon primus]|uniref:Uncharacterized protein n=1 Tax=Chloropicon primus TaxID=1764295 RepID=A0A5B8N2U2_9CHLO|nr:hypothetical protein A3770_20p85220 [Chloropicon primus]UPR05205.1 hypothetical protein HOP50_20g85550 [Chloropicon primus]|eukprot:QDZ26004.1 hypothetical protein A3770_20p85220 [Chloropicon primus]